MANRREKHHGHETQTPLAATHRAVKPAAHREGARGKHHTKAANATHAKAPKHHKLTKRHSSATSGLRHHRSDA